MVWFCLNLGPLSTEQRAAATSTASAQATAFSTTSEVNGFWLCVDLGPLSDAEATSVRATMIGEALAFGSTTQECAIASCC